MCKDLNPKQRLFCELYVGECFFNRTDAYLKAFDPDGSGKMTRDTARSAATRLLTNVNVLAYIDSLQEQLKESMKISKENLITKALEIVDVCSKKKPIKKLNIKTGKMEDTDQMEMVDSKAATMALTQVGKWLGYEQQNVKVEGNIQTKTVLDDDIDD